MDAPLPDPGAPLPTDVAALHALVRALLAEGTRLRAENAELKTKLDAATKHRFGRRSERKKPAPADPKPARRRDEHGRSVLPEHLERRDVVHDPTDEQKRCPACGRARECIGEQTAEQLDLDPPRFFVLRTRKRSCACRQCDPTAVKLRVAGKNRTARAHRWVGIGDADFPYVVFDFTTGYTADGPRAFFDGYAGYLQADALAQYEGL
ncbi:putative Helix-turn-helix domain of transposase IS66 [Gemmata obscuriglobus]|uniref:Transposase IS66 zinc-finger binding domain-containing protein n=1 Tax=Gemmata obscuriglobus TaxID=114 RepID=A0A2Z3H643_9BACT|nr:hypothetical protein C1280_08810 [Gemmata obscuriglobus]QEG30161.1 putative Helix-turn-helix domain of transposase IS66 [Gemmata obscuriglobus]VTS09482.1 Transposase OS=Novosphingobium sp. AP12 GN=PMI02_03401 PE=4 SV=1: zf-IS66: DDE_Tnp_IS66 [Gemmata obscuriglobus UQM 2246]